MTFDRLLYRIQMKLIIYIYTSSCDRLIHSMFEAGGKNYKN